MRSMALDERAMLDRMEPRWRQRGYTLIREPSAEQLPAFLRDYRPDAIATGRLPSLVIEVLPRRGKSTDARLENIRSLLRDREDWQLEVIYSSSEGAPIAPMSPRDIIDALHRMRLLQGVDGRAALMLGWSALEAVTRLWEPDLASGSLSPGTLIDVLVSIGHASQEDGAFLRQIGATRNKIAHGRLDLVPDPDDLARLARLIERLNESLRSAA